MQEALVEVLLLVPRSDFFFYLVDVLSISLVLLGELLLGLLFYPLQLLFLLSFESALNQVVSLVLTQEVPFVSFEDFVAAKEQLVLGFEVLAGDHQCALGAAATADEVTLQVCTGCAEPFKSLLGYSFNHLLIRKMGHRNHVAPFDELGRKCKWHFIIVVTDI